MYQDLSSCIHGSVHVDSGCRVLVPCAASMYGVSEVSQSDRYSPIITQLSLTAVILVNKLTAPRSIAHPPRIVQVPHTYTPLSYHISPADCCLNKTQSQCLTNQREVIKDNVTVEQDNRGPDASQQPEQSDNQTILCNRSNHLHQIQPGSNKLTGEQMYCHKHLLLVPYLLMGTWAECRGLVNQDLAAARMCELHGMPHLSFSHPHNINYASIHPKLYGILSLFYSKQL